MMKQTHASDKTHNNTRSMPWKDSAHLVSSLSSFGMGHKRNSSFAPNIHLQAALAATRPKTTQSSSELPPRRLLPCTPPMHSPAQKRPGMGLPLPPMTRADVSIS